MEKKGGRKKGRRRRKKDGWWREGWIAERGRRDRGCTGGCIQYIYRFEGEEVIPKMGKSRGGYHSPEQILCKFEVFRAGVDRCIDWST
jgi:hypothetical protein